MSKSQNNYRQIGIINLEAGGYVLIGADSETSTEDVLMWAEEIIARKRKELEHHAAAHFVAPPTKEG